MIPLLIGGGLLYLLINSLSDETSDDTSEFSQKDIITDYAKFFVKRDETIAKIHATKSMNKLISGSKNFKVGKTGVPEDRNIKHTKFKKMYIIVESDNKKFINKLEAHYNEKYIDDNKNRNCKIGSAGEMTEKTGRFFLYFIANK